MLRKLLRALPFAVLVPVFALSAGCSDDPPPPTYYGPGAPTYGAASPAPASPAAAPASPSPSPSGGSPLAEARAYAIARINQIRAQNGRPPLAEDACLDQFAEAGSAELARDHRPHAHFIRGGFPCGCQSTAENQGDPKGWLPGPIHQQIDQILTSMMNEGPGGGHHDNLLARTSHRTGVGLKMVGPSLYFTNDFCN